MLLTSLLTWAAISIKGLWCPAETVYHPLFFKAVTAISCYIEIPFCSITLKRSLLYDAERK